jgi:hypothetical protein
MDNPGVSFKRGGVSFLIAMAIITIPTAALAQVKPSITGIKVQPSQLVLPPASSGLSYINAYGDLSSLSDEHSTIFPPGTVPGHEHDYLFFVTPGMSVLTGSSGPDSNGVWTLDFASGYQPQTPAPDGTGGPIFLAPFDRSQCPAIDGQHPQDATFDLNYAAVGSVILDPTRNRSSQLLMIYEGTTLCLNVNGGATQNGTNGFYATLGVATSEEFGKLWPVYRNNFTPLPGQSTTWGPDAPANGAFGGLVCVGNSCERTPSPTFGRYPIVSVPYSIDDVVASGEPLSRGMGEQAPSAFVDDVHSGSDTYVYVVHNYGCPADFKPCQMGANANSTITIARARLSGDVPLSFEKWTSAGFSRPGSGIGGEEISIFPVSQNPDPAAHKSCQDPSQNQSMGSISYVPETNQYLLIFLCSSGKDPDPSKTSNPTAPPDDPNFQPRGAAWFYSTLDANPYDLSYQGQWSAPSEIAESWHWFDHKVSDSSKDDPNGRNPYCIYSGWYPSFMSLGSPSGRLSTTGYAFSMDGCTDQSAGRSRLYRSRVFTISLTNPSTPD